jgi:hypothetical protein
VQFIKNSVMGFIQSRLYSGSWNLEEFTQNFELEYIRSSWVDKYGGSQGGQIDVFNSTSFASYSLTHILSRPTLKRRRISKGPLFQPRARTAHNRESN